MDELTEAMTSFERALREHDAGLAATVLDPDYVLTMVQPSAGAMTRDRWLDSLEDYVVHDYDVQERRLDIDGDLALSLQRVHVRSSVKGQERGGLVVVCDVWRRRFDGWRLWRRQSTAAPYAVGAATPGPAEGNGRAVTVAEIAAVLATVNDGDPELSPQDIEQHVLAFRALKDQGASETDPAFPLL